jgi:5'-3' exonuclease
MILIIDFMNYFHRCRVGRLHGEYALEFIFFKNFRYSIDQFKPEKIFIALEGHPKFRYDLYASYKANRVKTASAKIDENNKLLIKANTCKRLLSMFPVTFARHPLYEADDIIGSLVENLKDEYVTILSGDSDLIQLLQKGYNRLQLFNPIKKQFIAPPEYYYLGWKCLAGDASDNIPKLLTPAKALKTIQDPKKIEEFLSIEENRANFSINKELIEIKIIPADELIIEDCVPNFSLLKEEFTKMEFNSIVNNWEEYINTFNCVKY